MNNAQLLGQSSEHITWLSTHIGIHQEMEQAWLALQQGARNAGFELQIASGFRSFERQLMLWERKYLGVTPIKDADNQLFDITSHDQYQLIQAILLYSALPGASRHHWGCDIDVYAPNLLAEHQTLQLEAWEYQTGGPFAQLSKWLKQHAGDYQFFLPYQQYRGGIAAEPWHLSYYPVANGCLTQLTLARLTDCLSKAEIAGKAVIMQHLPEIYQRFIININEVANV
jgi:LAS superfamily LD-carboxypeptidase LdcB